LEQNVEVTNVGVVAVGGYGLIATKGFKKRCFVIDAVAIYSPDPPRDYRDYEKPDGDIYRSIRIHGTQGHFKVKSCSDQSQEFKKTAFLKNAGAASPTFFMNAAETSSMANVGWASYKPTGLTSPVIKWEILKDIKKGEELLARYQYHIPK
jgi:hypothetical protein